MSPSRDITFLIMGDAHYYPMLRANIDFIRSVYPSAPILVYDWSDATGTARLKTDAPGVTVIPWGERIRTAYDPGEAFDFEFKLDLARRYNGRFKRTVMQRIRKQVLKNLPRSAYAARLIKRALQFENLLCQKIHCMLDGSARVGPHRMAFLDADAMLVKDLGELVEREDYDIGLTLEDKITWTHNRLGVLNSGTIYFGADVAAREAFIRAWIAAADTLQEVLREQSSMVRMLNAQAPDLFHDFAQATVTMQGHPVRVLVLPKLLYNNTNLDWFRDGIPYVVHVSGTGQNQVLFEGRVAEIHRRLAEAQAK